VNLEEAAILRAFSESDLPAEALSANRGGLFAAIGRLTAKLWGALWPWSKQQTE